MRTLCVRTCDGYYFPISTGGRRDRQTIDAEACQSMYGQAGQAELFLHRPGSDIATAASVDGKLRYADQPYAFLFREEFNPSCQAQLKAGLAALAVRFYDALRSMPAKEKDKGKAAPAGPLLGASLPRMRPRAIGEDPETVSNRAGGLAVGRPTLLDPTAVVSKASPIRLVGDAYYIDLYDMNKPPVHRRTNRPPLGYDLIGSALAAEATALSRDDTPTQ